MSVEINLSTGNIITIHNVTAMKYRALCSIHGKRNVTIVLMTKGVLSC